MRSSRREFLGKTIGGVASAALGGSLLPAGGCYRAAPDDGRIHLRYWDKWDGFEGDAMRAVVKAFNASQDRIAVHYTPVGVIDRKLLAATSGGDPPDVAGLWENNVTPFAEQGAITPLDELMQRDGIPREHWIPVYRRICTHQGIMWAVPTTPYTTGLHYNIALFEASASEATAAATLAASRPAYLGTHQAHRPPVHEQAEFHVTPLLHLLGTGLQIIPGFLPIGGVNSNIGTDRRESQGQPGKEHQRS